MTDEQVRSIYLDPPDEGLSPETSHPRFVELAPEAFYDESNEFTPFGNDDGSDAFRDLEAFYEYEGAEADPAVFLAELLEGWGFRLPEGVEDYPEVKLLTWIAADDMNEVLLGSVARARIATAIGQLKITGRISPEMQDEGLRGLRLLRTMWTDTTRYPEWPHRARALHSLDEIEGVLAAAARGPE